MHLLFLSRWFPYPPDNGSKIRIYNLLRGLSRRYEISLISFYKPSEGNPDIKALQSICADVQVVPWKEYRPRSWQSIMALLSSKPRAYVDTYSEEMATLIRKKLSECRCDLVIASQIDTALYAPTFYGVPAIFEEVEVGVPYDQAFQANTTRARMRGRLTWFKHRRYLAALLGYFDACTVVSDREEELLKSHITSTQPVVMIPNCVDLDLYEVVDEAPIPNQIIFIGSLTYQPNYEGIVWFLREVFPLIRQEIPDAHLTITGDHANKPLPQVDGVTRTGMVDNVYSYVASSWLSVVPLRTGGGTRLKILESMALSTPVVTTTKGAEGLDVRDDQHVLVANEPDEFARAVIKLLGDPIYRKRIAKNGISLVREKYNWGIIMEKYGTLVQDIIGVTQ